MIIIAKLNSLTINDVTYDSFKTDVDTSLSIAGKAADAKAVGEALSKINMGGGGSGGGEHNAVIAAEQELTFSVADGVAMSESLTLTESLVVGNTYKVVWGSEEFVCQCYDKVEESGMVIEGALLGNVSLIFPSMPDTGEPFYIGVREQVGVIKRADDPTTTIAIYGGEEMASKAYVQQYVKSELAKLTDVSEVGM